MKPVSLILVVIVTLVLLGCASQQPVPKESGNKVLLILRETRGSTDKQFMETKEAVMMKSMLEEAGFKVVIASASGRTFFNGETLRYDFTLDKVKIADYVGFIIPCMSLHTIVVKPEEVAIAKQIADEGKPVAAQRKGVLILGEAGALAGKRYSYESKYPLFDGAIHSGNGVVQDGNIITSSYCPAHGSLDQTVELTQALIDELKK